jgi:hypothetical protein
MKLHTTYAMAAIAMSLVGTSAFAADAPSTSASPAQKTADKDFGKLSTDGMKAFQDLHSARLAIFDGETAKAKTFVESAQAALTKTKTDDTVFTKAEADLKPGPGMKQNATAGAQPSSTAVSWVPVGGQMTLGEDFVSTPDKAAGVAKANTQLKSGQKADALATLKLANIDVFFVEEVAPLATTISGVDKAVQLVDQGHYYEANQALKSVEDGMRFDTDVLSANPDKAATAKNAPANSGNQTAANTTSSGSTKKE